MIKIQDYLNELKVKKEIGKDNFKSLYRDSKKSFYETTAKQESSTGTYFNSIKELLKNDKRNIAFYDFVTTSGVISAAVGAGGILSGNMKIPDTMIILGLGMVASVWSRGYGKSAREIYTKHRETLKDLVKNRVEDHEKNMPFIRDANDTSYDYDVSTINGVEVSDEVLDVISTKLSEEIMSEM